MKSERNHHGKYVGPDLRALHMIQPKLTKPVEFSLSTRQISELVDQSFKAATEHRPWSFPPHIPGVIRTAVKSAVRLRIRNNHRKPSSRPSKERAKAMVEDWLSGQKT